MSHRSKPLVKPNYVLYERLKRQLPPNFSAAEYQRRVQQIARRCGV